MEDFFRAGARTRAYLHRPNADDLITACSRLCLRHKKAKEKLISAHTIFRFIEQLAGGHKNSFIKWSTLSPIHKTSVLIWLWWRPSLWCQFNVKKSFFFRPSNDCDFPKEVFATQMNAQDSPQNSYTNFSRARYMHHKCMEINSHDHWAQTQKTKMFRFKLNRNAFSDRQTDTSS